MDPSQLLQLIKQRRSVYPKNFIDQAIPNEKIDQMLEAANWAPTHKFTEPWRFIVFRGEGLNKLADFQAERYKLTSTVEKFNPSRYKKLKLKPLLCSHVIAICMVRDSAESVPEVEEVCAVACAVQNMLLMASSLGIGCYWGTGGVTYDSKGKDFFDLSEEDKLMGFLYIGASLSVTGQGKRSDIKSKTTWVD